jgi:hypothetical protein
MGNPACNTVDATLAVRCCADYCGPTLPAATDGDTSGGGPPPKMPNLAGGTPYGVDPDARAGTAPAGAKNVLLIVVDDLRPEIAGLFGKDYMHTPNIDAFAQRSLGLQKAHVQQALCGPSRASFLTGRRPETTRIYDLHTYWRDAGGDFVTIPQHFAENGYATRGFGKIMHPVCGSAAHDSPGECDPLSWTLPYFHSPNENRWTCSSGMVGHGCDAEMPSHYAVSKAEERAHPLPDTQNCDAAMQQLVDFAAARDDPSQSPPPPFFLAMGFHKYVTHLSQTQPASHTIVITGSHHLAIMPPRAGCCAAFVMALASLLLCTVALTSVSCAVLCCAVLCCAVLCCAVLCQTTPAVRGTSAPRRQVPDREYPACVQPPGAYRYASCRVVLIRRATQLG